MPQLTTTKVIALYVDRANQQWIVRDGNGNLWVVPMNETPWEHRRPFEPTEETVLELVPRHCHYMLGLPL